MATALPFSALLDLLRARGLPIGLLDYRDLALLLSRYDGSNQDELRTAIAALLGRDRIERSLIADCFDELYPAVEPPAPPPPPPPPDTTATGTTASGAVRKIGWRDAILGRITGSPWISGAAAVVILTAAVLVGPVVQTLTSSAQLPPFPAPPHRYLGEPLPRPVEVDPDIVASRPPKPPDPPPVMQWKWRTVTGPAAVAFAALLLLRIGRRWTFRRWSRVRTARSAELASLAGPRFYRWRVDDRTGAIPRTVVEDVATILGRRHEVARTGRHLHVDLTLRRTLEAGLFPRLVYEPPHRLLPLLVLEDVGADMRPWRRRVDWLLHDLERLGIPISRWYFDVSANHVWRTPSDPGTTLDALARAADDAALMIVSAGAGVRAALAESTSASWIRVLTKWPARTWVTPLTSRAHWRPELAEVPCSVWPMTAGGLHAAARELLLDATHRPTAPADVLAGARPVGRDDLERVKRLVALVPPPAPVNVIEALRVRFTPDVPSDVILPLLAENESLDSSAVRLPDAEVTRLLAAIRRDNPDREIEVRRFLLGLLDASEPVRDSAAYLRWQADHALHEAIVAELAGQEPSGAIANLQSLADGPLSDEVRARLAQLTRAGRLTESLPRGPLRLLPRRAGAVDAPASSPPWFTVGDGLVTVGAAALAAVLTTAVGGIERVPTDYVRGVWALTWDPPRQALTVAPLSPSAPRNNITLLRDGSRLAFVSLTGTGPTVVRDRLVDRGEAGSWYQLQAPLRDGNLALSDSVWVPGSIEPTQLLATFKSAQGAVPDVSFTLYSADGRSVAGRAGRPVDVTPGVWTVLAQPPGYQELSQSITVKPRTTLSEEFTLTKAAPVELTATIQLGLVDVYASPLQPPVTVEFTQNGKPVTPAGTTPSRSGIAGYQLPWNVIGQGKPPGVVDVRVSAAVYQPSSFQVTGKPGTVTVSRHTLMFDPRRVEADFTKVDVREVSALIGKQNTGVPQSLEARANLFNIFSRARRVIVSLERPQGTFSRDLWSMLDTSERITPTSMDATVAYDVAAYLETWMGLAARGMVKQMPAAFRQAQQQNQQNQAPLETLRLSIPPQGRDGVFLDLEYQPRVAGGGRSRNRLALSLRSNAFSDPHPYLIHQLLVQGGYPVLYRLRPARAAMAK
ncbi:MAG: hypothetical protein DMF91_08190 [Acidobacteria bacterium]|nr:MAG: hypothetical protein DMF91_08190 [Acidobacteriota bacterium]